MALKTYLFAERDNRTLYIDGQLVKGGYTLVLDEKSAASEPRLQEVAQELDEPSLTEMQTTGPLAQAGDVVTSTDPPAEAYVPEADDDEPTRR